MVAAGELQVVGIVQEQHPARALLFQQWKGLDFPILWDPFGVCGVEAVPDLTAVDEHGNTVRTPTCFETSLENTALVIREGLILMFRDRIAQTVRWSEIHGEPELLWSTTLDGAGNTIMAWDG